FFQAEDGIRAFHVTGVQTCALPISAARLELDAGDALVLRPRRADVDRIAGRRRHAEDVGALAGRGVADRAAAEAVAPGGREIDALVDAGLIEVAVARRPGAVGASPRLALLLGQEAAGVDLAAPAAVAVEEAVLLLRV